MENLPEWAQELVTLYKIGNYHQFLIDRNIRDLVFDGNKNYSTVRQFLIDLIFCDVLRTVKGRFDHLIYFSLSTGIREFSRENKKFGSSGQKITCKEKEILSELSINNEQLNQPLMRSLTILDNALKTRWSREKTDSESNTNEDENFKIGVIIDNLEHITPETQGAAGLSTNPDLIKFFEQVYSWGSDARIKSLNNISILLTENRNMLPASIRGKESGTYPIGIPIPDMSVRQHYLQSVKKSWEEHVNEESIEYRKQFPFHYYLSEDENLKLTANITKGYRVVDIKKILDISRSADPELQKLSGLGTAADKENICRFLDTHKNEIICSASKGLLEIVTSITGFNNIGGLEEAKNYFKRISKAILSDDADHRKIIPKGVLLTGPPGTGKSLLAKALSDETKLNLVRMGNIRSMWVGETERNLSLVLDLLKSMAPTIVFIDEIDQALGARQSSSGDSGVSGRIFQQILDFMGNNDNRGDVIWIAATNRADLLDDAMISRFDRIIPVLLPGSKIEWKRVVEGILNQLNIDFDDTIIDSFLNEPDNIRFLKKHSGRSIETVIRLAYQNMLLGREGNTEESFNLKYLQQAFDTFKININEKMFELQTLLAIASCNETTFIPKPSDSADDENRYEYPFENVDKLIETTIENRTNDALDQRIQELKQVVRI
ncbi:MAG: ATP-binding protein [Thermodesulfobacteriota bacterium]|nr:ATP-binding protein [Thermodesulfobacteriota bacterium]